MTPTTLYQALVRELESVMPPRVASRVLREGLSATGSDPESLDAAAADVILKGPVFRQLQAGRPAEAARAVVGEILARLAAAAPAGRPTDSGTAVPPAPAEPDGAAGAPTATTAAPAASARGVPADHRVRLDGLRAALRPLNLYFGWAEVRKLRAQLQLVDDEQAAGRDVGALLEDAEAQLELVHRKVEDHLVLQARDLADLEEALEVVASLGGHRVRRLESLVATVRDAQAQRTIAEGEVERAQKLARDLRKLVESSVLDEGEAPPDLGRGDGRPTRRRDAHSGAVPNAGAPLASAGTPPEAAEAGAGTEVDAEAETAAEVAAEVARIDPDALTPEVTERLRALDVDGERRTLDGLLARHAEALRYAPQHAAAVDAVRAEHTAGRPAAEALARLEELLQAEERARRETLRREFEALRDDVEALAASTDVTDVRRAVHVVLDLVVDALPPLDDVTAARDLHAEVSERAAAARRATEEATRRAADLREQRAQVRDRLEAALARAAETSGAGGEVLARARAGLEQARALLADEGAVEAAALEQARDAEAAWERALAESSDDRFERLRARARELGARLQQLPELPALTARRRALEAEVAALELRPDLTPAHVRTVGSIVDQLFDDARAATVRHLEELGRAAGAAAPEALLRALQAAARSLEEGAFPDLPALDAEVRAAGDERRAEARRRYLRARQEARRLAAAETEAANRLEDDVAAARTALDGDADPLPTVERLEVRLAEVETEVAARLAGFGSRLDAALARFRQVARLNNDDVAAARRVLSHLDGQRDAVGRVSLGLQARLFEALGDAERRLEGLQEAFEATRAIADQLVAGNLLDDVLGGFDALFGSAGDDAPAMLGALGAAAHAADPEAASPPTDSAARDGGGPEPVAEDAERLRRAWAPYLDLSDVSGAVLLGADGSVRAGRPLPGSDLAALARSLDAARASWQRLGGRLGDAAPEVAVLDAGGPPTLVAPLGDAGHAVVWTTASGAGAHVGRRLRHDHAVLEALLRAATRGDADRGPA